MHTHTHTHTSTLKHTLTDTHTHKHTHRHTYRQIHSQTDTQRQTQTHSHAPPQYHNFTNQLSFLSSKQVKSQTDQTILLQQLLSAVAIHRCVSALAHCLSLHVLLSTADCWSRWTSKTPELGTLLCANLPEICNFITGR